MAMSMQEHVNVSQVKSEPTCEGLITVPSFGRPFKLGMLYDCRNEHLVPDVTLWGPDTLEKSIEKKNLLTNFKVSATNNWSEKATMLDMKANAKLSVLSGLIDLKGSAKYLDVKHSTSRTEQVTLRYETMSHSEELPMEHIADEKIEYPEAFDHGTATHVVTGIEYGGNAFFVFDRNVCDSNENRAVGDLEAIIKKVPFVGIQGKKSLKITADDKLIATSFNCQVYGDCQLCENPASFEEAVKIYKQLPELLSEHGYVPLVVTLYPLSKLDTRASGLISEISSALTEKLEEMFENLDQVGRRCDDLLDESNDLFLSTNQEIQEFKNTVGKYIASIKRELAALLPQVRGGKKSEKKVWQIHDSNLTSPFSFDKLQKWLKEKEEELRILRQYLQYLPGVKMCKSESDLNDLIHKTDVSKVFCLTFQRNIEDQGLEELKDYVNNIKEQLNKLHPSNEALIKMFKTFHEIGKGNKDLAFGISEQQTNTRSMGMVVKVYNDGVCVDHEFIPPSIPGTPEIFSDKTTHDSVTLKWAHSKFGNITKYEVFIADRCKNEMAVEAGSEDYTDFKIEGLSPGLVYDVKIRAVTEMGPGPMSGISSFKTLPCAPPGKPVIKQVETVSLQVVWQSPESIGENVKIKYYIVEIQCAETKKTVIRKYISAGKCFHTFNIEPNEIYRAFVIASCGVHGNSDRSDISEDLLIDVKIEDVPKARILAHAQIFEDNGNGQIIYNIPMTSKRQDGWIEKYEFGNPDYSKPEKVIMMVGATGSGKSTLINGLVNYLFGIEWNDPYRLKLIVEAVGPKRRSQAKSQTKKITSYTFFHQPGFKWPFTLTLIDTPGFGDTDGIKRDQEITHQMKDFFTTTGPGGIDHLDAVGFVTLSSLPRLSISQKYIFDQVLALFGQDIAKNICMLLTFADGKKPQVLSALKAADIPYQKYHKFNNSALYREPVDRGSQDDNDDESEDESFDEMFWKMGRDSFRKFLNHLSNVESRSLLLTTEVLQQREILTMSADGIRKDIRLGLSKLDSLKTEIEVVQQHEAKIAANKGFKYIVEEEHAKKHELLVGQYITNCVQCNRTCHEICGIPNDEDKHRCWAMTNEYCRICPGKCHWKQHGNFPFKWVYIVKKVEKTSAELYQKYVKAGQERVSAMSIVKKIGEEFLEVHTNVIKLTEEMTTALNKLKSIALKTDPLSTSEYVDMLIEDEKNNAEPGWQKRIEHLQGVRDRSQWIEKFSHGDECYNPFNDYKDVIVNLEQYLQEESDTWYNNFIGKLKCRWRGLFKHH